MSPDLLYLACAIIARMARIPAKSVSKDDAEVLRIASSTKKQPACHLQRPWAVHLRCHRLRRLR